MTKEALIYQTVNTRSGQVGYCKTGNGPPLILIVGYSGTLYHWNRHFIDELSQNFTVYLVDNRKIGLSESKNDYSMLGMAQDIIDFIDELAIIKPILFGWSMGGIITQSILKLRPEIASGIVLLATVPHHNYTSPEFIQLLMNSEHLPANEFRLQLYAMFFSTKPSESLKELITRAAAEITDYHYRFNFEAKELQDYSVATWAGSDATALSNITIPTLILKARNDLVVSSEAAQFFATHIPFAKLIDYPTGGHFFLHQNPEEVARDVGNFFNSSPS